MYNWTLTACYAVNQEELNKEWKELEKLHPNATIDELDRLCEIVPVYRPCYAKAILCKFCKRWYKKTISNVNAHLQNIHMDYFKVLII